MDQDREYIEDAAEITVGAMQFIQAKLGIVSDDGVRIEPALAIRFTTASGTEVILLFEMAALKAIETERLLLENADA